MGRTSRYSIAHTQTNTFPHINKKNYVKINIPTQEKQLVQGSAAAEWWKKRWQSRCGSFLQIMDGIIRKSRSGFQKDKTLCCVWRQWDILAGQLLRRKRLTKCLLSSIRVLYGLAEETMAVTPALLAALTGSFPAEASLVRVRTAVLSVKGQSVLYPWV